MPVTKITVARLHNCGNYEHVRYEIAVDVPENGKPARVLTELETVLENLKPDISGGYEVRRAREILAKPAGELTDIDCHNMDVYRERVRKADEESAKRQRAIQRLNELGGTSVYTDAKERWDDDYRDY